MLEDFYPAAERILADIVQIIQNDPKLNSVEIIPRTTNANKSPVHHEEHSLGLESWCIKPMYCHAYQCVMNLRQNKQKSRDLNRLNTLLVGVLMINPDITTFWNMRKDLIKCGKLDPYFELRFAALVLSRKPKSADVYTHRKWVLSKILRGNNDKKGLLGNEMHVCEVAADRYSNNYHAWTHRLWCLNQGIPFQTNCLHYFLQELNWSLSWVFRHVSDYSGFHYRQQVLSLLCDASPDKCPDNAAPLFSQIECAFREFCASQCIPLNIEVPCILKIIISELSFNTGMISDFVAHEALWYHRRFILHLMRTRVPLSADSEANRTWVPFESSSDGVPSVKNQKIEVEGVKLLTVLHAYEASFLKQNNSDKTDTMSKKYANKHQQWLTHNLKRSDIFSSKAESEEFQSHCKERENFKKFIAPSHPATNGLAERSIQTLKRRLKASADGPTPLTTKLQNILFRYRATPLASGYSSAELYLIRKIRIRLDAFLPNRKALVPTSRSSSHVRSFRVGERIQARVHHNNQDIWEFGTE